jgi:hypothetical protein
VPAHIHGGF